ncbi:hypothetical protein [Ruminococcus sp.]|uniref:hypothetical protein n=1 Tax=Ruminococcus sp. TaxID=41978 RepID=UPI003F104934
MITAPISKDKLDYWKQIWQEKISSLKPNRISGIQLNKYFQNKYSPTLYENKSFQEIVKFNLIERYGEEASSSSNIICYLVNADVYVGIDLGTGFFQVESKDIEKCIPIYDDLYVKRGLDKDDLQNFVLVGQYIELLDR